MQKVRGLRAGFWEQLKATIKRNVVRKMRNKRDTIRVFDDIDDDVDYDDDDDDDDDYDDKVECFEEQETHNECYVYMYHKQMKISGGGGTHHLLGPHHLPEAHLEKPLHGGRLGPPWSFGCEI